MGFVSSLEFVVVVVIVVEFCTNLSTTYRLNRGAIVTRLNTELQYCSSEPTYRLHTTAVHVDEDTLRTDVSRTWFGGGVGVGYSKKKLLRDLHAYVLLLFRRDIREPIQGNLMNVLVRIDDVNTFRIVITRIHN